MMQMGTETDKQECILFSLFMSSSKPSFYLLSPFFTHKCISIYIISVLNHPNLLHILSSLISLPLNLKGL